MILGSDNLKKGNICEVGLFAVPTSGRIKWPLANSKYLSNSIEDQICPVGRTCLQNYLSREQHQHGLGTTCLIHVDAVPSNFPQLRILSSANIFWIVSPSAPPRPIWHIAGYSIDDYFVRQPVGWTGFCKVWKMDYNRDSLCSNIMKKRITEVSIFAVPTNSRIMWAQWYTSWKGQLNSAKQYGFAGRMDTQTNSNLTLLAIASPIRLELVCLSVLPQDQACPSDLLDPFVNGFRPKIMHSAFWSKPHCV